MPDFWRSSGYDLLDRCPDGRLVLTEDWLRAYLARPELLPPPEACRAERALHASLLESPTGLVTPVMLVALKDRDARENWEIFLAFRDHLLAHPTIEDAYLALFLHERVPFPALFLDQLVHVLLRAVLDGTDDPFRLRAAECLFRSQRVTIQEGAVLLADAETIERHGAGHGRSALGRLVQAAGASLRGAELDVLNEANAASYWARSERFDLVLDLTFGRPGLDALCRVLEAWVRHFLDVRVSVQPLQQVQGERWAWHVGLDAEASAILNDLYAGRAVDETRRARVLSLFRLDFADPSVVRPQLAGRPVYLALAGDAQGRLRLKPQNLLVNLPLAEAS